MERRLDPEAHNLRWKLGLLAPGLSPHDSWRPGCLESRRGSVGASYIYTRRPTPLKQASHAEGQASWLSFKDATFPNRWKSSPIETSSAPTRGIGRSRDLFTSSRLDTS